MTEPVERTTRQWNGALTIAGMNGKLVSEWERVSGAVKEGNMSVVMSLLHENPDLVNAVYRKGRSWFTLLHWAAAIDAPKEFVGDLIDLGAFRTVRDSSGQRPADVAARRGLVILYDILEPKVIEHGEEERLALIQELFHGLVRAAMVAYKVRKPLRLPQLSVLTELPSSALWFPIPGMAGGFHFWLEHNTNGSALIAESWCRICGGSGMRHRITPFEILLQEEGFV